MKEHASNDSAIHLFWTGGLDSTFRLLHALWNDDRPIQPIYIAHAARKSKDAEDSVRAEVRAAVLRDRPELAERLLPERLYLREDIEEDPEVEAAFRELTAKRYLGKQFTWLGAFARRYEDGPIELCLAGSDPVRLLLESRLEGKWHECRLVGDPPDPVFGAYRFPVIHIPKKRMLEIAKDQGFDEYLSKAWYCYRPTADGQACGLCNPCLVAAEAGVARNTRPRSKARVLLKRARRGVKRMILRARARFG